ncbi:MAG: 4-(cytidine 5'-diphospho)-2-C-methyl-D-erythritol kinase [Candidatus Marinimicrobia bacterium]|nr:4-(cytidine 5'-diphospho)-2-C-methyl-D-erythritol kinase [Candidatus Neomarinimicrobiota bacterium]|tara:strand:- start:17111 stop:17950 length:840 start_codon:yes stop_codon:yes gene_type:complete
MQINSYAKINLGLHVLNERADGFHNITTIFQELNFCDQITIEESQKMSFDTNVDWVDRNNNTCVKAIKILQNHYSDLPNFKIFLQKNIPTNAGLGGGSSNGTATLKAINQLCELNIQEKEMKQFAEKISADSTFFVNGGLQGGEQKGEKLYPIKDSTIDTQILLVMPSIRVQTSDAFMFIKKYLVKGKTDVKLSQMLEELKVNKLSSELFYNDFEMYVFKTHPEIGKIKLEILDLGAKYASLSGSGSTVFGIFSDKQTAQKAQSFFSPHYSTIIANPKI